MRNSRISSDSTKSDSNLSDTMRKPQSTKLQFKDFYIVESIGEGSFGRVFKGIKKDDGQVFALKVMKK